MSRSRVESRHALDPGPNAAPTRLNNSVLAPAAEAGALLLAEAALAGAGAALLRSSERTRGDPVGIGNPELVLLQAADLVAQPSRFLELEIGGGLAHPLLEVGDVRLEVVADEVRPLVVAGIDGEALARGDMGHDVVDVALDAFRRDAVRRIVLELLLAPDRK